MSFKSSLKNLKKLNLSFYPIEEIRHLIDEIGFAGTATIIILPGDYIMRARRNVDNQSFKNTKEISYKPAHLNDNFYRASTPKTTMFYGSVIPHQFQIGDIDRLKLSTFFETSTIKVSNSLVEESFTFGLWQVIESFQVVLIATREDFMEGNPHIHNLGQDKVYVVFNNLTEEQKEKNNELSKFYTSEFLKTQIQAEYSYLHAALFTEYILSKKFSGVYYPSTRTEYGSFNIAIHPETVNSCMNLVKAIECTVYIKNGIALIDNKLECKPDSNGNLMFKPLKNSNEHFGREKSLEIIDRLRSTSINSK